MEKTKKICDRNKCMGCYSCYNSCPKECITMKEDQYGFVHPEINMNECIKCNLCKKSCPVINNSEFNIPKVAYAAWALNDNERKTSTSGGVASVFSNYIIENDGIVFGSSGRDTKKVKHIKVQSKDKVANLKGSKYVQSKVENIYKEVKIELESSRNVIFIGTPCQVAGIKGYLRKDYDNLTTVDIICHGTPSQKILNDYIKENYGNEQFDNISFRDKNGYNLKLLKNDKVIVNMKMKESLYYLGFMKALFFNESCYECPYAKKERVSDITIGDFWGLGEEKAFNYDTSSGISVILINTEKGMELVGKCKDRMFLEQRAVSEAVNGNSQLRSPSIKHKNYELFRKLYISKGFNYAAKKSLQSDIFIDLIKENVKKNKVLFNMLKKIRDRK